MTLDDLWARFKVIDPLMAQNGETLRHCDDIGWNSAKIISRLSNLTISLSADLNMTDLLQREHLQILTGIEVG